MKNYPKLIDKSPKGIIDLLESIISERVYDVKDFNSLKDVFISGRKVNKVPTASNDVDISDKIGDFNYDLSYIYILVDNSGTAEWRRASLGSW